VIPILKGTSGGSFIARKVVEGATDGSTTGKETEKESGGGQVARNEAGDG